MNCKLLMLGVLLVLTACGGKKEQKSEDNGVNKHTEEYILQRIDTIYKTVGKATVDAEGNRVDYIASDFNRDSAYCSQRYYALMQQALEVCEKTGEVLYDYDHWVCGQDFSEDWSYKVKKIYQSRIPRHSSTSLSIISMTRKRPSPFVLSVMTGILMISVLPRMERMTRHISAG